MTTTDNPAPAAEPKTVTITLSEPIARAGGAITEITLRKPKTGALRGLKVEDLFTTDVNTLIVLLPRIAQPAIVAQDVEAMEAEDLLEIAGAVKGFFMSAAMLEQVRAYRGD